MNKGPISNVIFEFNTWCISAWNQFITQFASVTPAVLLYFDDSTRSRRNITSRGDYSTREIIKYRYRSQVKFRHRSLTIGRATALRPSMALMHRRCSGRRAWVDRYRGGRALRAAVDRGGGWRDSSSRSSSSSSRGWWAGRQWRRRRLQSWWARRLHGVQTSTITMNKHLYRGWNDVTESMVTIRSPFCGYNAT